MADIIRKMSTPSTSVDALHELVKNKDYAAVNFSLRAALDEIDGIKMSLHHDPGKKEFASGVALIRDATHAKPFTERLDPHDPVRQVNNMLLRALGSLRGIDHVLTSKSANEQDLYGLQRLNLQTAYQQLLADSAKLIESYHGSSKPYAKIEIDNDLAKTIVKQQRQLHTEFNTKVVKVLHAATLDKGLTTAKEYDALITYYRDLSSVLEPAQSLQTITQDIRVDDSGIERTITHIDTAHPITEKTAKQKAQLAVMKEININPAANEKNFHTLQNEAMQIANQAFHDLIASDDRRLGAQMRLKIAPGLRNGFRANYKIQTDDGKQSELNWLRCGSPTYVGKGAKYSAKTGDNYTHENLLQLKAEAEKIPGHQQLHINMLLTKAPSKLNTAYQAGIIKATRAASEALGFEWSRTPTNWLGRQVNLFFEVSKKIKNKITNYASAHDIKMPFAIDKRVIYAALTTLVASQQPGWTPVIVCASGQDRTGTVAILFSDMWARNIYRDLGISLSQKEMSEIHGRGTHATTIAAHTVPGSNGMKYDSQPHRVFSEKMVKHYYPRFIANTNKPKKTVAKDAITPEMVAINKCYKMLASNQNEDTIFQKIMTWINSLLTPKIVPVSHQQNIFKQSAAEKITQHCLTKVGQSKNLTAFVKQLEAIQQANATLVKTLQNTPAAKARTIAESASILDKLTQLEQGVKDNFFTAKVRTTPRIANK